MRLVLVRHGESICGASGIVGGERGCTGLTERGFAQARALRDRLASEGFRADVLYASTLPRAIQTAEVVGEALGLVPTCDPELCELIPGEMDGTRWEDWSRFEMAAEPDRPMSPGGESLNAFARRVRGALERLAVNHEGQTVVAACHGGPIATSLRLLLGMTDPSVTADIDHTSITEWLRRDGHWHLVRFNDAAHLAASDLASYPTTA